MNMLLSRYRALVINPVVFYVPFLCAGFCVRGAIVCGVFVCVSLCAGSVWCVVCARAHIVCVIVCTFCEQHCVHVLCAADCEPTGLIMNRVSFEPS